MATESTYERGDKFIRVISLLDRLHRTRSGMTARQLADELETQTRSVQRYIKQMRAAGMDIEQDEQNRYRIGTGSRLQPMQFTKPEGVAVLIALRLLQQMGGGCEDALLGAVGRIAAAMRMPAVTSYLGTMVRDLEARPAGSPRGQVGNVVVQCFADRLPCEIEYRNADGETSRRVVETHFLEPRPESRTIYLYGRDHRSREMRMFRMDRVQAARAVPTLATYHVPDDFDINAVTGSSWGVWQAGGELDEVLLRFSPSAAARVRQSTWHPSAVLTDLDGGGVELRVRVASEIELRPWVLGWGSQVEVLAPGSLRDHVAESMRAGLRIYDAGVSPS